MHVFALYTSSRARNSFLLLAHTLTVTKIGFFEITQKVSSLGLKNLHSTYINVPFAHILVLSGALYLNQKPR